MENINAHEIIWNDVKVSRFWDYVSHNKYYDDLYFTKMVGSKVIKYLDKKINLQNKTILDYGSGPGYLVEHIKKLNRKISYHALDFSEDSIHTLKDKYSKYENFKNAYFVNKFPTTISERFDLVVALEVIEHLDDEKLNSMISEIKNLLKQNLKSEITR